MSIQCSEFFVQGRKLLLEVLIADILTGSDADVAARIQAPALRLDLGKARRPAETGDVGIGSFGSEDFLELRLGLLAAEGVVGLLAAVEADEIRKEADLSCGPVAVSAVDLAVDMACVDEEDGVGAGRGGLPLVQKPEGAGERDGIEHVRPDGDHDVDAAALDELATEFLLGGAGIGGGVRHDESGTAFGIQRGVEELDPEVVCIVGAREAEGVAASGADGVGEAFLVDGVDVEGRIRKDEVELSRGGVGIVVVADGLLDIPLEAMDGEVHAAEVGGGAFFLLAEDGELLGGVLPMLGDEAGALDEHAAGAAGGVEDVAVVGLEDLGEEADDAGGGVELSPTLSLGHGELGEEVFVDAAEGVVVGGDGDLGDLLEETLEQGAGEEVVGLREDAGELGVLLLDGQHGGIHLRADVLGLGKVEEVVEPGLGREVEDPLGMVGIGLLDAAAPTRRGTRRRSFELGPLSTEAGIGKAEEDEPEDRGGVFGGLQAGVCPELIGGIPKTLLQVARRLISFSRGNPFHREQG